MGTPCLLDTLNVCRMNDLSRDESKGRISGLGLWLALAKFRAEEWKGIKELMGQLLWGLIRWLGQRSREESSKVVYIVSFSPFWFPKVRYLDHCPIVTIGFFLTKTKFCYLCSISVVVLSFHTTDFEELVLWLQVIVRI